MEHNIKIENKTRQKIKAFLAMNGYTLKEVIKKINELHPEKPTTTQNITNKLARETIKFTEVVEIADILGYTVEFIPKTDSKKIYFPATEEHIENIKQISAMADEDMLKIPSCNFGETIIYGKNAASAAEYLLNQQDLSKADEMMLHQEIKKIFNVTLTVTNNHL